MIRDHHGINRREEAAILTANDASLSRLDDADWPTLDETADYFDQAPMPGETDGEYLRRLGVVI